MSGLTAYANASSGANQLSQYMAEYGINQEYKSSLEELGQKEVVLALDDSGSMKGRNWDMLKKTAEKIVRLALMFDSQIDIYFLNRGKMTISNFGELDGCLYDPDPSAGTPLLETFDNIIAGKRTILRERSVVVYALTDGEPWGGYGKVSQWFQNNIAHDKTLRENLSFSFQMCTHDKNVLEGYSRAVDGLKGLKIDVMGTYADEKKQVEAHNKKRNYEYTEGEHYVKQLIGSFDEKFDLVDEQKVDVKRGVLQTEDVVTDWNEAHPGADGCCTIQ